MTEQTRAELEQRFDTLIGELKDAQIQANQGIIVVMTGFQAPIETICTDLSAADKETADALKPKFIEMISALDTLAAGIQGIIEQGKGDQ